MGAHIVSTSPSNEHLRPAYVPVPANALTLAVMLLLRNADTPVLSMHVIENKQTSQLNYCCNFAARASMMHECMQIVTEQSSDAIGPMPVLRPTLKIRVESSSSRSSCQRQLVNMNRSW